MALTEPLAVTLDQAYSLSRVSDDAGKSEYWNADRSVRMIVESALLKSGRTRHVVRIQRDKIAADPLTAINRRLTATMTTTFDVPGEGFTEAEKIQLFTGTNALLSATTNAVLKKVLGFEH